MQGAAGFAFALLAMPLLVWNGFSLAEASMLTAINALVLTSVMVFRLRQHIKWRILGHTVLLRAASIGLGILVLVQLNSLDKILIRQFLGVILLLIVGVQLTIKPKPREKLSKGWWWLAFSSSGVLNGMVGFGGPPAVLWVMAHNWSNLQSRAMLTAFYWATIPIQILLLLSSFGQPLLAVAKQAVWFIPIVIAGVFVGIWFGNKLDKTRLKQVAYGLLFLTGVSSLLAPYMGLK